jgi:hypothetical protein
MFSVYNGMLFDCQRQTYAKPCVRGFTGHPIPGAQLSQARGDIFPVWVPIIWGVKIRPRKLISAAIRLAGSWWIMKMI